MNLQYNNHVKKYKEVDYLSYQIICGNGNNKTITTSHKDITYNNGKTIKYTSQPIINYTKPGDIISFTICCKEKYCNDKHKLIKNLPPYISPYANKVKIKSTNFEKYKKQQPKNSNRNINSKTDGEIFAILMEEAKKDYTKL